MKLSHLIILSFTLMMSQVSMALSICLHARKGHSFVSVQEDDGMVVMTLGLWPNRLLNEKYPKPVTVNRSGDRPHPTDATTCRPLKITMEQLAQKGLRYTSDTEYGPYVLAGNNCTHFAVRMFNYGSQTTFDVPMGSLLGPGVVRTKIKAIESEQSSSNKEVLR